MAVTIKGFGSDWSVPAPAKASLDALYATTAAVRVAPLGNRWVTLGDSITAGGAAGTQGDAWPKYAALISQQKFRVVKNAGVSGNTSAQARARIATDVLPHKPQGCTVLVGTNDIAMGVPMATWQENVQGIVAELRANGIAPVLITLPPRTGGAATLNLWNTWLRRYASEQGIPLVDFYGLLADPLTGDWKAGYSSDDVHPLSVPLAAMGRLVAEKLGPLLPASDLPISRNNADANNFVPNPMFAEGATVDGVPDKWVPISSGTGTKTYSLVTDPAIQGNWAQTEASGFSADAGLAYYLASTPTGWSAGDRIAISAYLQVPSIGATSSYSLVPTFLGTTPSLVDRLTQPLPEVCRYYTEFDLPITPTQAQLKAVITGGTGTIKFAHPTVYNLTEMGLV